MYGGEDGGGDGRLIIFRNIDQILRIIRVRFLTIGEGIKSTERKKTGMKFVVDQDWQYWYKLMVFNV